MLDRRCRRLALALALGAAACGDDIPSASDTEGSTGATSAASSDGPVATTNVSTTSTTGPMPTTTVADDSDTGFDPPQPACGNGFVEEGEQCDDANAVDDDGCSNACLVPCGIDWESVTPAPTLDSTAIGVFTGVGADGTVAIAAMQQEVIADKRGNLTIFDDVVRVRVHESTGRERWETTLTSDDGDLSVAALKVGDDGTVYVATTVPTADGGKLIRVQALAPRDGSSEWTVDYDGTPGEDDTATGLAIAPDGDLVVSGRVRAGDGDTDAWLRKMTAADGTEVWTTTYSGQPNNNFSVDVGGPVTVGDDGTIYMLMAEYVDFETRQATLLAYDADGTDPPLWTFAPSLPGTGQAKQHNPLEVAATDDGGVLMAFTRNVGGDAVFHVYKLDGAGAEQWSLDSTWLADRMGSDYELRGLGVHAGGLVLEGRYVNDFESFESAWGEVWLVRMDNGGNETCRVTYQATARSLLPPSLGPRGAAVGPNDGVFITGERGLEGESAIWVGRFRPPSEQ